MPSSVPISCLGLAYSLHKLLYSLIPFSFDARGRPLHKAIPWADESVFKKKAHFHYDTNPPALRIKNIQTSDAGLYKCRVDFQSSPTRNWRINVTVLGRSLHLLTVRAF